MAVLSAAVFISQESAPAQNVIATFDKHVVEYWARNCADQVFATNTYPANNASISIAIPATGCGPSSFAGTITLTFPALTPGETQVVGGDYFNLSSPMQVTTSVQGDWNIAPHFGSHKLVTSAWVFKFPCTATVVSNGPPLSPGSVTFVF